jgi:hypothetical protein
MQVVAIGGSYGLVLPDLGRPRSYAARALNLANP